MEAVNQASNGNLVALHTTDGCTMSDVRRNMSGIAGQGDCHNATNSNTGCTVTGAPSTYGPEFNAAGGGIVALEWRNEGIRQWIFPRNGDKGLTALPASTGAAPDPSTWGPPLADFPSTSCDIGNHFRNQSIIVNIDLCGYFTEAIWANSGCKWSCAPFLSAEMRLTKSRPGEMHGSCCQPPRGFHKCVLGVWGFPGLQGVVGNRTDEDHLGWNHDCVRLGNP
jgi:hypothetical protein